MGETIRLTAEDGFDLSAYLARPHGHGKGGIVVVQEIFGVNDHIRSICDRFAADGYAACAPAIFDRQQPGFECGYTPDEVAKARPLMVAGDFETYMRDVAAARDALLGYSPVSVTGYCLGGSVAFAAATRLDGFLCAIPYYGGKIIGIKDEQARCPMLMYFGEQDHSISMEDVRAIQAAQPGAEIQIYDAQHGFMCDQRSTYSAEHAEKAWAGTIAFLDRHSGV